MTVFTPVGATVNLSASDSTSNVALTPIGGSTQSGSRSLTLFNSGSVTAFLAWGDSSVVATAAAGFPLPAGAWCTVEISPGATHMAGIVASGSATVYATSGRGAIAGGPAGAAATTVDLGATDNAVLDQIEVNTSYGDNTGGGVESGALRVTIANDSTGVLSVDDNAGSLTVDNAGTFAVQVDAALPAGTNAIGKLAANSGVDIGDVDILSIAAGSNTIGNTKDAGPSWTGSWGVSSAVVTSADATTPVAVTDAPTSSEKIVITDIIWSSEVEGWLEFEEETSGTILFKVYSPANGSGQITPRTPVKLATANKKLMVDAEAAGNVAVTALYYSEA
jgi:hypothetical protein